MWRKHKGRFLKFCQCVSERASLAKFNSQMKRENAQNRNDSIMIWTCVCFKERKSESKLCTILKPGLNSSPSEDWGKRIRSSKPARAMEWIQGHPGHLRDTLSKIRNKIDMRVCHSYRAQTCQEQGSRF